MRQRDMGVCAEEKKKVPAKVGAVPLDPPREPHHHQREQPPQIPNGEARLERLSPAPRVGTEPLMREVELHARDPAEQRPEAEPLHRAHSLGVRYATSLSLWTRASTSAPRSRSRSRCRPRTR